MKTIRFIVEIFRGHPWLCALNSGAALVASLIGASFLFSMAPLVDMFFAKSIDSYSPLTLKIIQVFKVIGIPATFPYFMVVFIILVLFTVAAQIFCTFLQIQTKYAILKDLMVGSLKDFFTARWQFFSGSEQGKIYNTLNRELTVVGDGLGALGAIFAAVVQIFILFAIPFYISWKVSLLCLVGGGIVASFFLLLSRPMYYFGRMNTSTANVLTGIIYENISSAKLVLGSGNAKKVIAALDKAYKAHLSYTIHYQLLNNSIGFSVRIGAVAVGILALVASRWFAVSMSEVTVLLLALYQATAFLGGLLGHKNLIASIIPSYEQIKELRQRAQNLRHEGGNRLFQGFHHEIHLEGVLFSYPGREAVLKDINMRILKGQTVAFVGKSGSGKTTLIDILMGFYEPDAGQVLFDDIPLAEYNTDSYRQSLGYVPQESVLFNMSVKDNLLWAKPDATDTEIDEVCRLAYADEFIKNLPQGYGTIVGDRGVRLSGGQVQRLALARAFLRKPEILFLDEATSSLDGHSETLIQKAIEAVSKETTVIMVAHRLATIKNADVIYVLDGGRVIESGNYEDLCRQGGVFFEMARFQELGLAG